MEIARILCTDLAGLRAQAIGLAEAAGLTPDLRTLTIKKPWSGLSPSLWPNPLKAVDEAAIAGPLPRLIIGCGGAGARVAAALRGPNVKVVVIQHPRMALKKFDLVFAGRHDGIAGANVVVTRNALHRVTMQRLAAEADLWRPFFKPQNRPLVAVLLGGSNGRYRFDAAAAEQFSRQLAGMGMAWLSRRRAGPAMRLFPSCGGFWNRWAHGFGTVLARILISGCSALPTQLL
jgi:mitochondrial fission protein ELM1